MSKFVPMENIEKRGFEIIKAKHIRTGGNNGTLISDFDSLNLSQQVLREIITKLEKEGKINIREGINNKIIMLK